MKKKPARQRTTKSDQIVVAAQQQFAHRDTSEIMRQMSMLQHEADVHEAESVELRAKLVNCTQRRATISAWLTGLRAVVARR